MSWEGILTAFRMPALDGKIKVKKCFNYRYPEQGDDHLPMPADAAERDRLAYSHEIIVK